MAQGIRDQSISRTRYSDAHGIVRDIASHGQDSVMAPDVVRDIVSRGQDSRKTPGFVRDITSRGQNPRKAPGVVRDIVSHGQDSRKAPGIVRDIVSHGQNTRMAPGNCPRNCFSRTRYSNCARELSAIPLLADKILGKRLELSATPPLIEFPSELRFFSSPNILLHPFINLSP